MERNLDAVRETCYTARMADAQMRWCTQVGMSRSHAPTLEMAEYWRRERDRALDKCPDGELCLCRRTLRRTGE